MAKPTIENQVTIPHVLPVLPMRKLVVFPNAVLPLAIGREASRRVLDEVLPNSTLVGVVAQKDADVEEPTGEDLYRVGVADVVLNVLRPSEEQVVAVVQASQRIALRRMVTTTPFISAEVEELHSSVPPTGDKLFEATVHAMREAALQLADLATRDTDQLKMVVNSIDDPGVLADFLAGSMEIEMPQKQELLEELDVVRRVRACYQLVGSQLEVAKIQKKLQKDVSSSFSDMQRKAYLREQMHAIQKELGECEEGVGEQVVGLRNRLGEARLPEAVVEQCERELRRLTNIPPASPEYSVIVSYLEAIVELPWSKCSEDNLDLRRAQEILDRDHYDLEKVKRRLIEYLAVRKLNPRGHGPILCFLGAPGVGKTSLGQSIADALGRKFVRMSLGGLQDEAEIRGHRRTYIGSMPGRVLQEIRRAGTRNPVMMLDEIDKVGADFRGDPASALLEVLDPRQNHEFVDHYLDLPFDLSQVMFICTANLMDTVPPALQDRMEVIELAGYTDREKLEIARRYLVKRQRAEHGLKEKQCRFEDAALERLMHDYTREAGVRELERQIAAVCRAVGARVAKGETTGARVTPESVRGILGPPRFVRETRLTTGKPGVVTGLAWTPTGGDILHIEAIRYPGKGNILLTGNIGEVMKESAQAALSLVKSRVGELGIAAEAFKDADVHIHVPAGAVPKDGPSAGIAMFTAIASLFSGRPVRTELAMTGEISLRGLVLPIGGLKEKTLAALRANIATVIFPKLNEKDLPDIPADAREQLTLIPVETVDDVLATGLEGQEAGTQKQSSLLAQRNLRTKQNEPA